MLNFLKNWTLPVAMLAGALGYFIFANFAFLEPTKPFMSSFVAYLTPALIFVQLLLTFCKVQPHELMPSLWHGWLLLFQLVSASLVAVLVDIRTHDGAYKGGFRGCDGLSDLPDGYGSGCHHRQVRGSASSLTTYTLLSNVLAAIVVPLMFPLVEPHADITFVTAFLKILSKVFPLLLCPFFLAMLFRYFLPGLHHFLLGFRDLAFYLWGVALAIVTAQTVKSLVESNAPVGVEVLIALAGLVTCAVQFYLGKRIGTRYSDRISAGQALGQKNTVLAIWMAYTYLDPLSSVGPGSYVLWQNLFNSYQLWKKRKNDPI